MNLRLLKKYFKLGIILSVLSLTACQFSPTSTTVTITNDTNEEKTVKIPAGTGFMQGIFVEYGITVDDDVTDVRNGGFGSTTK